MRKGYYKIKLLRREISKKNIRSFLVLLFRIAGALVLGSRRIVFAIMPSDIKDGNGADSSHYDVKMISSGDMVNENLKNKLREHNSEIQSNIESMLDKGACLWAGYWDGKLAHISFTRTGDNVRRFFFPMRSDSVLISHCVTFSAYRGLGIYPATLAMIVKRMGEMGVRYFYIDSSDWNVASVQSIEKLGFKRIGYGKCKRVNKLVWYQETRPDFTCINRETTNNPESR